MLAKREGIDAATDPRPRVLSVLFTATLLDAGNAWHCREATGLEALLSSLDEHLDAIVPAVSGHW